VIIKLIWDLHQSAGRNLAVIVGIEGKFSNGVYEGRSRYVESNVTATVSSGYL
jgi:hypothetical protein